MKIKRIGIFAFYQKKGLVEDDILYLLNDLKQCLTDLVIVCNGALAESGKTKLLTVTDQIYVRENKGFDVSAFQYAMISCLGWKKIIEYDEMVLCNDTFFGPFVSFEEIFKQMNERAVDFWGLSKQPESLDFWCGSKKYIPAFIQSFFMVFKKDMLQGREFQEYWERLNAQEWNVTQVVVKHEQFFTHYFESLGFQWDVFADMTPFTGTPEENQHTAYLTIPYELIRYCSYPFLKKKCITGRDISQGIEPDNGSFKKAMDYIHKYTSYHEELIYSYMLHHCNKAEIADKLHLNYIQSTAYSSKTEEIPEILQDCAVVVWLRFEKMLPIVLPCLKEISAHVKIYFICSDDIKNKLLEQIQFTNAVFLALDERSGRLLQGKALELVQALPVEEEYIGYIRDEYEEQADIAMSAWISLNKLNFKNILSNSIYVHNILNCFRSDNRLSRLFIPELRFAIFMKEAKLYSETGFWIRRSTISEAAASYYGSLCTQECASLSINNETEIINEILSLSITDQNKAEFSSYFQQKIIIFCKKQELLYLYGIGGIANRLTILLEKDEIKIDGYIVSDGQTKVNEMNGKKVFYLSEILNNNIGIILALDQCYHKEIIEKLNKKELNNIIRGDFF